MEASSQVNQSPTGKDVVVRDMADARLVCDYIEGGGDRAAFLKQFAGSMAEGFDPDRDLTRVGVGNQTTMLSNQSLAIFAEARKRMVLPYGPEPLAGPFRPLYSNGHA